MSVSAITLSALDYDVLKLVRDGQDPRRGLRGRAGAPRVGALTRLVKHRLIRKDETMPDTVAMGYVLTESGRAWLNGDDKLPLDDYR
jgi:hypothetical protein